MSRPLPPRDRRYSLGLAAVLASGAGLLAVAQLPLRSALLGLCLALLALTVLNHVLLRIPFFPYDRILSAVSQDGLVWTCDPGVRLDVGGVHPSCQVYYPSVIPVREGWRMYYRAGGYDSAIGSAFSHDGLCWDEEPGYRIGAGGADGPLRVDGPCVVALGPDDWRLYHAGFAEGRWRLCATRSSDSLHWRPEGTCIDPGAAEDAKDPCVIPWGAGFRIYYVLHGPAGSRICTAVSDDGLHWGESEPCTGYNPEGLDVRTPRVVPQEGAGLRLYFAEFPRPGAIGSRIVSAASLDGVQWTRDPGVRIGTGARPGLHGAFCPDLVGQEGEWRMYFGGYWGNHWLAPHTLFRHRPRALS